MSRSHATRAVPTPTQMWPSRWSPRAPAHVWQRCAVGGEAHRQTEMVQVALRDREGLWWVCGPSVASSLCARLQLTSPDLA